MATLLITPRFRENESPRKLNIFHVKLAMENINCKVEYGRRTAKGAFLLRLSPEQDPRSPLTVYQINGIDVKATMPDHLNLLKGIVHHPELAFMDDSDAEEMFAAAGVMKVYKRPQDPYAILAWNRSTRTVLPDTVLVGWDRVRVKPVIPRPKRCFCCQSYGHIADDCTRRPVCSRCGEEHELDFDNPCQKPPHCAACGGPHPTDDPNCTKWTEEKKLMRIKHQKKVSYSEALKITKKKEDDKQTEEQEERRAQDDENTEEQEEEPTREEEQEEDQEMTITEDNTEETKNSEDDWKTAKSRRQRRKRKIKQEDDNKETCKIDSSGFISLLDLNLPS